METGERPPTTADSMSQALEGLSRRLGGHATLAAARGISRAALDSMYGVARELCANGHHADARPAFELLCLYDHLDPRHWQGLAACRQAARDYAGAAGALAFAVGQSAAPAPEVQLQLAECLVADGASEAAGQVLDRLREAGGAAAGPLADRARVLRDELERPPPPGPDDRAPGASTADRR